MRFSAINLRGFNEQDVREEILAPLLRRLGYRSGSEHHILREQLLQYPHQFIGRKSPGRDPRVRGKADYVMAAGRRVRWVLEAKAPSVTITEDEIEQAWTYASHAEIRAVYFGICNGERLIVLQTDQAPGQPPVLDRRIEELDDETVWSGLVDLLSPEALLRNHPRAVAEFKAPLGPTFGSLIRINSGWIHYDRSTANVPALLHMQIPIVGGAIQHNHEGGMIATVDLSAPSQTLQETLSKLGLMTIDLTSPSEALSTDPRAPTMFRYESAAVFPSGTPLTDITAWRDIAMPAALSVQVSVSILGILEGGVFSGMIENRGQVPGLPEIISIGRFSISLV